MPTGNVLKITNFKPGELQNMILSVPSRSTCEHIIVNGEMNDCDFRNLSSSIWKYKSINLSGVKADKIPKHSFCDNKHLETFICPANLKNIEAQSFVSCINLKTVIFPESLESIGVGCFQFCRKLETPPLPGVTLGVRAFHATLNDPWETMKEKIVALSSQTFKIAS